MLGFASAGDGKPAPSHLVCHTSRTGHALHYPVVCFSCNYLCSRPPTTRSFLCSACLPRSRPALLFLRALLHKKVWSASTNCIALLSGVRSDSDKGCTQLSHHPLDMPQLAPTIAEPPWCACTTYKTTEFLVSLRLSHRYHSSVIAQKLMLAERNSDSRAYGQTRW